MPDGAVLLDAKQPGLNGRGNLTRLHPADVGHDGDLQAKGNLGHKFKQSEPGSPRQPQIGKLPIPPPGRFERNLRPTVRQVKTAGTIQPLGPVEMSQHLRRRRGDCKVEDVVLTHKNIPQRRDRQ